MQIINKNNRAEKAGIKGKILITRVTRNRTKGEKIRENQAFSNKFKITKWNIYIFKATVQNEHT